MIIHLGWDVAVTLERIIAILSAATANAAPETRSLIAQAKAQRRFTPCPGAAKAYVLIQDPEGALFVIASSISPATLRKRLERPVYQ